MMDPKAPTADRISAAVAILDRAHGPPPQAIAHSVVYHWDQLSDEDLAELERLIRILEARPEADPEEIEGDRS
jgi:hypothetical protein